MSLQIINTYSNSDGIKYIEFIQDGKTKILKVNHFISRYGDTLLSNFKTATSSKQSLNVDLSLQAKNKRERA